MTEETNKASLIGMITSPKAQFTKIKVNPIIWLPMLIIAVIYAVGAVISALSIEIPEELLALQQDEELLEFTTTDLVANIVGGAISPLLVVFIVSVVFWVVAKIIQSEVTFKQLFSMNTFIMFISSLGILLNGILSYIFGNGSGAEMTSLSYYVQAYGATEIILTNIEVFSIWTIVLTAFGLNIVAGFSKVLSWAVPILLICINIFFSIMLMQAVQSLLL